MHRGVHRYPFVWIDKVAIESQDAPAPSIARASVRLTSTVSSSRGGALPTMIVVEVMAQAALAIVGDRRSPEAEARLGYLAGMDRVRFLPALEERPLAAGDRLEIEVERQASFGALVKVKGVALRDGELLAEGELILGT